MGHVDLATRQGSVLAVLGPNGCGKTTTVRIFATLLRADAVSGATRHILTGHTGAVRTVAIAPDGTWLASAGADGTVRVWDAVSGATRHTLTGHTGAASAVAIAPDGTWLASAGLDNTVRIWDPAAGGEALVAIRVDAWLIALVCIPGGIVAGGERGPYLVTFVR